ncbi:MAG TPA: molybdopterin cofactor-binding domain-containing protein [Thermoanaerobaculia bacterium]|nr:molybdopterin cofactor-binding domain-containing protein [Thermoanaerobaculia bacterium]
MSRPDSDFERELIEHEVRGKLHWFDVDRRGFLKILGGGLLVCLRARAAAGQESGRARGERELPGEISAWLHIGESGRVTVYTGKVEMGQNIRTSLAQQVAEELRVPVDGITMVMGETDRVPWDAGTFGSRTTPTMGRQLRAVAATAREQLVDFAADHWKVERATLVPGDGKVTDPAGRRVISYGELAASRNLVREVGQEPPVTSAAQWKVAGTPVPKVNGKDFVTGRHVYTSDCVRPGMLHGKVLRPAGFGAKLVSLETAEAEKLPGVRIVRDGDFVGVVAPDAWTAERAVSALEAKWSVPAQPSDRELFEYLKKNESAGERSEPRVAGSVEQGMASAAVKLAQTYTVEYIAHAPLEPRAAVAEWNGDRLAVWTGTQRPFAVRDELAEALRISTEKVVVRVPDTGAAYGGKHTGDAAVEAARLAKAAGHPVKVVWTREEEFTWAYVRPAGVIEVTSGARRDGTIVAWEFHNINSGPAAIATPYAIPNQKVQFHPARSPLRQGSYRGLAATANHFARETHMDELAHSLGIDPLAFRLKNLEEARLKAVFEEAAKKFGWGRKAAAGRGFGIAGGVEKGGYVATCVEVEVDPASRQVRLLRVVEAFECGAVINPDGLRNQVEGAIVQAIGGALFEAVRFENGRIVNARFSLYRVPRMPDVPQIEVVILDRKDLPSAGAGETPIVGLAPAVGNAIFAATGIRLRGLPLAPEGLPDRRKNA